MKFDLDGGVSEAASGARRVLSGLRTLLLETAAEDQSRLGSILRDFGFRYVNDTRYGANILWIRDQQYNFSTAL